DSLGWVGSTAAGGVEADVVPVNAFHLDDEVKNHSAQWAGKVLLVVHQGEPPPRGERRGEFARFGPFLKAAYDAHAVAVIGGQGGGRSDGTLRTPAPWASTPTTTSPWSVWRPRTRT
ncbi:MAG TPA: hypothetical protein VKU44_12110, partial [Terriglobia bacterium]|nr:hypothetical protein [Terriglobia bacterium]